MRYPIQRQLLWPMLQVVLLGSTVTALLAAWQGMRSVRHAEEQRLQQLTATLADAGFPLTESVLKRMSELSGAQFVTLDEHGLMQQASHPLTAADAEQLATMPVESKFQVGSDRPVQLSHGSFRALRIPVRMSASSRNFSLVILTSQERWNTLAWQAAIPPLLAGLLAAGGATVWAWTLSQQLVTRIHGMVHRAELLAEGQFQADALPSVDDELRDLAVALNTTAEKLTQYESQVRQGERLKTLGQLGAGLAHQLRNGITGARMALDLHTAELPAESDRESLAVAVRQMELMESYLQRFLTVGQGDGPVLQELELSAVVIDALQLVEPLCRHHGIQISWQPPSSRIVMQGDAESLRQMLLNLLMNAIEAVQPLPATERNIGVDLAVARSLLPRREEDGRRPDEGGPRGQSHDTDSAASHERPLSRALSPAAGARGPNEAETNVVLIRVWDQGPGPKDKIRQTLFDRFVTDKPDGTGLGLSVAQEIANTQGGRIQWSRNNEKTVFEVTLPACSLNE